MLCLQDKSLFSLVGLRRTGCCLTAHCVLSFIITCAQQLFSLTWNMCLSACEDSGGFSVRTTCLCRTGREKLCRYVTKRVSACCRRVRKQSWGSEHHTNLLFSSLIVFPPLHLQVLLHLLYVPAGHRPPGADCLDTLVQVRHTFTVYLLWSTTQSCRFESLLCLYRKNTVTRSQDWTVQTLIKRQRNSSDTDSFRVYFIICVISLVSFPLFYHRRWLVVETCCVLCEVLLGTLVSSHTPVVSCEGLCVSVPTLDPGWAVSGLMIID